jgi:hypothetical protein
LRRALSFANNNCKGFNIKKKEGRVLKEKLEFLKENIGYIRLAKKYVN